MKYLFKQACHFHKRDYPRGIHEVPEQVEYDADFIRYVGLGLIVEAPESEIISTESQKARSEKLYNKLVAKIPSKKPSEPVAPGVAVAEAAKAPKLPKAHAGLAEKAEVLADAVVESDDVSSDDAKPEDSKAEKKKGKRS